jgi:tellurite resistance protein TerC
MVVSLLYLAHESASHLVKFNIPAWHWGVLIAWFSGLLIVDVVVLHRKDKAPSLRHATIESLVWIALGVLLGAVLWHLYGSIAGQQYFSGYLIEKSLSIDNVFAWAVIFSFFSIPAKYQYRVLFWGIFGALVMRAIFIFAGVAIIERFEPIVLVLAAVLLWTGIKLLTTKESDEFNPGESKLFQWFQKHVPVSHQLSGNHFFTRENGRRVATVLFLALCVVEFTDVIFAVDSVPAILAISRDPFIVFASNAAAILGLRSLYFVFAKIKDKFWLLNRALGILMITIGLKMAVAPEHIFGMAWFGYEVSTVLSLLFIALIIGGAMVLSLAIPNPEPEQ